MDNNQGPAAANEPQHLNAINTAARLPPFWEEDPDLWFLQIEAIFNTNRVVAQERKFQVVISQLPYKILSQVSDLARQPGNNPYDTLKLRLIDTYSQSVERRIQTLLEETQLGDLKPSQLLRQMQTLAGNAATNQVIKTVWLRALPNNVKPILAVIQQDDLNLLATVADKILETEPNRQVFTIEQNNVELGIQIIQDKLEKLELIIARLSEKLSEKQRNISLTNHKKPRKQHKSVHPTKSKHEKLRKRNSLIHSNSSSNEPICFFHRRFRDKARKCDQPCKWHKSRPKGEQNLTLIPTIDEARPVTNRDFKRIFVTDHDTREKFLIDSGASISIIRTNKKFGSTRSSQKLSAANGTNIPTYGKIRKTISLGNRKQYEGTFVLANVGSNILGADFLTQHNLLVDLRRQRLVDQTTSSILQGEADRFSQPELSSIPANSGQNFQRKSKTAPTINKTQKHFQDTYSPGKNSNDYINLNQHSNGPIKLHQFSSPLNLITAPHHHEVPNPPGPSISVLRSTYSASRKNDQDCRIHSFKTTRKKVL